MKSFATKALGAIAVVFSIRGLGALAGAAADAQALESQFSQVFDGIGDQASKTLDSIASDVGALPNRIKGSFTQIAAFAKAAGMQTEDALSLTDRAMRAVADSSAFYDKSLEQTTESLQSFLKGNYANDAALGLSATETTRNTAANALYGKSFAQLAEDQKQLTLLKMVEDANALSGALGQAARESDTWSNQMGNLKQQLKDAQATVGSAFLQPAIQAIKLFSTLIGHASDAIKSMTGEGRLLNRMFDRITAWLKKAQVYVDRFVTKVGGAENAFKLLAIAAAAIFAAFNAGAIVSFLGSLPGLLNPAHLKILGIAAVIALLFLAVDDFINFMQGNDSVIGEIFEAWGIDADGVRQSIIETWEKVKSFLSTTWETIKTKATDIWNGLKAFWEENGDGIINTLIGLWEKLKTSLVAAWNVIKTTAMLIFNGLKAFWETWGGTILSILGGLWTLITYTFGNALDTITGLLNLFTALFSGDWEAAWSSVKDIASSVWGQIVSIFTFAKDSIANVFNTLYDVIGPFAAVIAGITAAVVTYKGVVLAMAAAQKIQTAIQAAHTIASNAATAAQWLLNAAMTANPIGIIIALIAGLVAAFVLLWRNNEDFRNFFIGLWNGIKAFFSALWEGIVEFFSGVWTKITGAVTAAGEILKTAFTAVGDFFRAIWEGIASFFSGIWDGIISTVSGAGETIKGLFTAVGDFFRGIWEGVSSFFSGIWDGIISTVSGAADAIMGFLQPVIDGIKWVTDGIGDVASGIGDAVGGVLGFAKGTNNTPDTFIAGEKGPELITGAAGRKVFTASKTDGIVGAINGAVNAARSIVGTYGSDIAALAGSATASPATAREMINNTTNRNVTQNNYFENTYNGDRAGQQRSAEAMSRSANDATDELARALAYAR